MSVKLFVLYHSNSTEPDEYTFDKDVITIGRSHSNDLALDDIERLVSRQHAKIIRSGKKYSIMDIGSKNRTYLNGKRIHAHRPYTLHPGDVIGIGDFRIHFIAMEITDGSNDEIHTVFDVPFNHACGHSCFNDAPSIYSTDERSSVAKTGSLTLSGE